ncbi:MAG: D-beta-D-heptose 1-phosphate adenosyltransferase, partial [Candidatus Nanopelagicales bacterium]
TNAVLLQRAERVIVVADSSKFGRRLAGHIAPLSAMNVLVTDRGADEETLESLRDLGIDVVLA